MAHELSGLCWLINFPTTAMRLTMMKLCDCAEPDGTSIYPSVATISGETGNAPSTVRDNLAAFENCGLLDVVENKHGNRAGRTTVVRELNVARLRLISGMRVKGKGKTPSTHVMRSSVVDIPAGANVVFLEGAAFPAHVEPSDKDRVGKVVWALFAREPAMATGGTPESGRASNIGILPDTGRAHLRTAEGHPSRVRSSPHRSADGTPPLSGPYPSLDPPLRVTPLPPHGGKSRRGGRESTVDDLILKIMSPERERTIAILIEPIVRRLKIDAPDPVFALRQLADGAANESDGVLADACNKLLNERKATAKVADIEDAVKAAGQAAKMAATLANASLIFAGTPQWTEAIAALQRINPLEAELLQGQVKVRRDYLAKLGVTL